MKIITKRIFGVLGILIGAGCILAAGYKMVMMFPSLDPAKIPIKPIVMGIVLGLCGYKWINETRGQPQVNPSEYSQK